jgi:hypothetical protein
VNTRDTFEWKGASGGDGTRPKGQAVPMQRKPLVATILVSAVIGAVLAGLAPAALASATGSDDAPLNRGWETSSKNRGWDHDEPAGLTAGD